MLFALITYLFYLIVGLSIALVVYKFATQPKIVQENGVVKFIYDKPPSPLDFYLRVVFALNNLTKPGHLPRGKDRRWYIHNFVLIRCKRKTNSKI